MTTLTLDAIRNNPWNAVMRDLPSRPGRLLLEAAYLAANYCRTSEYGFTISARDGRYAPLTRRPSASCRNPYDQCEQRGYAAHLRLEKIRDLYKRQFGKDLDKLM